MLVLLPLLATLQYRWLGRLSEAEAERLQRSVQASTHDFTRAIDLQFAFALGGLHVHGTVLQDEAWDRYAEHYGAWRAAADETLVADVLLADAAGGAVRLRRWNPAGRRFEDAAWPESLAAVRERVLAHHERFARTREPISIEPLDLLDSRAAALVVPVTPVVKTGPPGVPVFGFTIVRFDPQRLAQTLPALVARHFGPAETTPYRVAVVNRAEPSRVLYESTPGAARALVERADVTQDFFGMSAEIFPLLRQAMTTLRPPEPPPDVTARGQRGGDGRRSLVFNFFTRRERGAPQPPQDAGRLRLLVGHRAGSLEAAVAVARTRNLAMSFGILLLMAGAVALIVVAARRAQALARQQLEFVAGVSHELRTPVAVITSAADNLAQGVVSDPKRVKQYGSAIQSEARRLGDTVERVLQFAGIEAGRGVGHRVPVSVADVIAESLAGCDALVREAGATIETAIEPGLPPVVADPGALRSTVQNLVVNAIKYGGAERWLRVTARAMPGRRREVAISVEDRGLGIGGADLPHVFEPFYRGTEAVARQIQGNGLGLSIVKRIVESHGGSVSVQSQPGVGSTFTVRLPAAGRATSGAQEVVGEHARARA